MNRERIDRSGQEEEAAERELDLAALLRGIGRHRKFILGMTLGAFVLSFAVVSFVKPRYSGEAKVFLQAQDDYFTRPSKDTPEPAQTLDPEAVQSQVQLVTSRDLARQAIRKLGLVGNAEFDPLADGMTPLTRLLVILGLQRDPRDVSPEDRVLDTYYDRLTVFPVAKSRVLSVEFTSSDPELAAKAANTIAELYLDFEEQAKRNNAKAAGAWLAHNIEDLRSKVADAETKVQAFRAKSGLLVGSNNTTISSQQLGDLNTQLANARSAQAEAQAKAKLIRDLMRQGRAAEASEIANNELIRGLAQQQATLRGQLALESRTLLPGHPRIQELTAQLNDVGNSLRSAVEKAARSLENDSKISGARVDALTAALEAQKQTVVAGNDDEVQLHALEREAAAARDQLENFLQKYREATARVSENAAPPDGRIISRAIAPQLPTFPKKVPTVSIATLAGLFLSLGIVVTRELLSGRAHVPADRGVAPVPESAGEFGLDGYRLQAVPPSDRTSERPVVRDGGASNVSAESDVAEIARSIAVAKGEGEARCVLVCAPDRQAQADETAIALARALALETTAILVDFDRGGRGLDRLVADQPQPGLSELVAGDQTFSEVIHRDRGSRLHVLPAGRTQPLEAAGDENVERLNLVIDALVATYDFVVLSGPPLAENDMSLDLAAWTDSVVVATAGSRADEDVKVAIETLEQAGASEIRVVAAADADAEPVARDAA